MIFPDFSQFQQLAQQGNFVPVYQEWIADLDTPVSAWYKVCAGQPYSFLLESVEGGESWDATVFWAAIRFGFWRLGESALPRHTGMQRLWNLMATLCSISLLPETVSTSQVTSVAARIGGLFGFWGYELIRWIEPRVPVHPDTEPDLPDGLWMQIDQMLILTR
jgi:anthranilate synthase component 1